MSATRKPLAAIGRKQPACQECGQKYTRERTGQRVCSVACGLLLVKRREIGRAVEPYRTKGGGKSKAVQQFNENDPKHVAKQAKAYFHRWVKWRDRDLPCCACGGDMSRLSEFDRQASHYRPSKMNSAVRYHPDNVNLGCSHCNKHRSGNESEYRVRLIEKIGIERVEFLESQRQVKRWVIDELREIRDFYKPQLIELGINLPRVR